MKKLLYFCAALLLALSATSAFAADLTGAWTGDFEIASGDSIHLLLTLKQDGAKLSGTVSGAQIGQIEIFDGKVEGDKISFSVMYNGMAIKNEGVISGDTIKLTSSNDQGGFSGGEAILTRSNTPDTPASKPACPDTGCTPKVQGAVDLTGAWTSTMAAPSGNSFQLTFNFKQDGSRLTGTVSGPQGDPVQITEGKVDGDKIFFIVSFNGMTIKHDGVVTGDTIQLTTKSDNADFPGGAMTLKRAK
jgi:hypothetical protein